MKIILVGHPGSQKIVPASKYLVKKYLSGFDVTFLNYKGKIKGWGIYVAGFLQYLTDEHVIFALDDYLISDCVDLDEYFKAEEAIGGALVSIKLCQCSKDEQGEYPVTTQYTLWDREYLISLLHKTFTPWRFEIEGSQIFKEAGAQTMLMSCIPYYTNSSLSSRWEGVRLDGLKEEDLNYIKEKWTHQLK